MGGQASKRNKGLTDAQQRLIRRPQKLRASMGAMETAMRCFGVDKPTCAVRTDCTWATLMAHCTSKDSIVDAIKNMTAMCKKHGSMSGDDTMRLNAVMGHMLAVLGLHTGRATTLAQRCRLLERVTDTIARNLREASGVSTLDGLITAMCKACPRACHDGGGREKALHEIKLFIAAALLPHSNLAQLRRRFRKQMVKMGFACDMSTTKRFARVVGMLALMGSAAIAKVYTTKPSTAVTLRGSVAPPLTVAAPPVIVGDDSEALEPSIIHLKDMGIIPDDGKIPDVHGMPTDYVGVMDNKKPHQPRIGFFNVFGGPIRKAHVDAELGAAKDLEAVAPVPDGDGRTYFFMSSKGILYEGRVNVADGSVVTLSTIVLPKLAAYHNIEAFDVYPFRDGLRVDYYQRGGKAAGFPAPRPTSGAALIRRGASGWEVTRVKTHGVVHPPHKVMRAVTDLSNGWMASATDIEDLEPGEAAAAGLPETHDTSLIWPINGEGVPIRVDGAKVEGLWKTAAGIDVVSDDEDSGTVLMRIENGHLVGTRSLTSEREMGLSGIAPIHL